VVGVLWVDGDGTVTERTCAAPSLACPASDASSERSWASVAMLPPAPAPAAPSMVVGRRAPADLDLVRSDGRRLVERILPEGRQWSERGPAYAPQGTREPRGSGGEWGRFYISAGRACLGCCGRALLLAPPASPVRSAIPCAARCRISAALLLAPLACPVRNALSCVACCGLGAAFLLAPLTPLCTLLPSMSHTSR